MPYRQFLITRPGALHLRQEGGPTGPYVHYEQGMEISLNDDDAPNGQPLSKWSNLGLRLLVSTPTKDPRVPASVTSSSKFVDDPVRVEPIRNFDPVTGVEIPATDGPAKIPSPEEAHAAAEAELAAHAEAKQAKVIESLLVAGEATNGAQEFNAWRASVIDAGVISGEVPSTKAGLLQKLATLNKPADAEAE